MERNQIYFKVEERLSAKSLTNPIINKRVFNGDDLLRCKSEAEVYYWKLFQDFEKGKNISSKVEESLKRDKEATHFIILTEIKKCSGITYLKQIKLEYL